MTYSVAKYSAKGTIVNAGFIGSLISRAVSIAEHAKIEGVDWAASETL